MRTTEAIRGLKKKKKKSTNPLFKNIYSYVSMMTEISSSLKATLCQQRGRYFGELTANPNYEFLLMPFTLS